MKFKIRAILQFLVLATLVSLQPAPHLLAQAQQPAQLNFRFEHITIEDGLSRGMVNTIYQDREGFMWFGTTDGLNHYDGYDFKVFRYGPFDSTSLSGNDITASSEDHLWRLWVGTLYNGLKCFDPTSETFRRFTPDPANTNSLSHKEVKAICEAPVYLHAFFS